jgi:hypothetical protein
MNELDLMMNNPHDIFTALCFAEGEDYELAGEQLRFALINRADVRKAFYNVYKGELKRDSLMADLVRQAGLKVADFVDVIYVLSWEQQELEGK